MENGKPFLEKSRNFVDFIFDKKGLDVKLKRPKEQKTCIMIFRYAI